MTKEQIKQLNILINKERLLSEIVIWLETRGLLKEVKRDINFVTEKEK